MIMFGSCLKKLNRNENFITCTFYGASLLISEDLRGNLQLLLKVLNCKKSSENVPENICGEVHFSNVGGYFTATLQEIECL